MMRQSLDASPTAVASDSGQLRQTAAESEILDAQLGRAYGQAGRHFNPHFRTQYDVSISALLNANNLAKSRLSRGGAGHQSAASASGIYAVFSHYAGFAPGSFDCRIYALTPRDFCVRSSAFFTQHEADSRRRASPMEDSAEDQLVGAARLSSAFRANIAWMRGMLLAFLEHFAQSCNKPGRQTKRKRSCTPFWRQSRRRVFCGSGLYNQLSWLADQLNKGYYGWKYRSQDHS